MSRRDLQEWLITNPGFRQRYLHVLNNSVANQFPALHRPATDPILGDWNYLMMCASVLADSENGGCQDAALRIAQACMSSQDTAISQKEAAGIVFDELANRLALNLSQERGMITPNLPSRLGVAARVQWTRRELENSIELANGTVLATNRFQRKFWDAVEQSVWTSASAPTSAGKSFIVLEWIANFFATHPKGLIVYLVPTRALINQVETDFRALRKERDIPSVAVSSLPMQSALRPDVGNFLVFTQERFHIFLSAFENAPSIDVIVVDEAQKVGDRQRGVLLQDVIERVSSERPTAKIIFASPQTENPEILLTDAPEGTTAGSVVSNDVTVNQNLLWANQVRGDPRKWDVLLCLPEGTRPLGSIQLPFTPTSVGKRLPFVAHALTSGEGGSLIYVDGPADAEKAAELLFDLEARDTEAPHAARLAELSELVRNAIHDKYSLARVLSRRIAFHYGNMPLIVRNEIERCFRDGHIKYLVCTSTLIEGVNLPCRNILVRGPKKGRNQPMNESDFWNLAGRAGRWGREFQGNVVCVDASVPQVWRNGAPQVRRRYRIERTTEKIMDAPDALIRFIQAGTPRDDFRNTQELEYMTSYLMAKMMRSGSLAGTALARRTNIDVVLQLEEILRIAISSISLAPGIIMRNPGISPLAMENLKAYFRSRTGDIRELLPVSPSSEDAASRYIAILQRISRHLAPVFGIGPRAIMLGLLITSWMRGYPLKRLITERINYLARHDRPTNVPATIRAVMSDVEEIARFQAPKFLACYVDVLREHLASVGQSELLPSQFDINVLLEFGVPGGTQLSLMGLGLSRTSALALAEIIASDSLSEEQCLEWLRTNDWENRDLPVLLKREVRIALEVNAPSPRQSA